MKKYFEMFRCLIVAETKAKTSNRLEFAFTVLGLFGTTATAAVVLYLMTGHDDTIGAWRGRELLFMQGFMTLIYSLQSGFFNAAWYVDDWLKDGSFLRFYTRPIHPIVQLALERFHPQGIVVFVSGLSLCWFGVQNQPNAHEVWFFPALVTMALLAALIFLSINLIVVGSAFWVKEALPLMMSFGRITDMARYPLDVFPVAIRLAFQILPLGCLAYWPTRALLREDNLLVTLLWMASTTAIFLFLLDCTWRRGMKRYEAVGG